MVHIKKRLSRGLVAALLAVGFGATNASGARAADACTSMQAIVHHLFDPLTNSSLLTPWPNELSSASMFGYRTDLGTPFSVATWQESSLLAPIRRLYNSMSRDFAFALNATAQFTALRDAGYTDQGTLFFASGQAVGTCTVPVIELNRGTDHAYAVQSDVAKWVAAGWVPGVIAFHAVGGGGGTAPVPSPANQESPPTTDSFSFGVIPDSQNEVSATDERMPKRLNGLAAKQGTLNLRWVLHVGDVQSWDTADHAQFVNNSRWFSSFEASGIPWLSALGNHDTGAVCPGGAACPGQNTSLAVRNTGTWNSFFPPSRFSPDGLFEQGKSDNLFRTFEAGGLRWLVLDLELWPRTEVIRWAAGVVASHSRHNVVVLTHAFLEADGSLSGSQGGYGANSPATLWNALKDYPNVVMFFSGHVGSSASTVLLGSDGHRVGAFLTCYHDATKNPIRLVTIDPTRGSIRTQVTANFDKSLPAGSQDIEMVYPGTSQIIDGLRWVR